MNQQELNNYVKQLNISADQILREEAEMSFLEELAKDKISAKLVFYGGTALRLAYNSPRFSEDIDLLGIKKVTLEELKKFLSKIIKDKTENWTLIDIKDKRNTLFALLKIKDEKLKHTYSIKIEIHKPAKKIKLETNLALIKSPVSIAQPLILVPTISELARLKVDALMGRKKARDIFDLWYISQLERNVFNLPEKIPAFSQREFKNELQVFLPKKYYPIIENLYAQINRKNQGN